MSGNGPRGFWVRSDDHRLAWAVERVVAKAAVRDDDRAVARWSNQVRRAYSAPVLKANLAAAIRRSRAKYVRKAADDEDDEFEPDLPALDWDAVKSLVRKLHEDAGRAGARRAARMMPRGVEPVVPDEDIERALEESFEFVRDVDDAARSHLRVLLREAVRGDGSPRELERAIKSEFAEFSERRAALIATTEWNRAASQAALLTYEASGVPSKVWVTVRDDDVDPVCLDNEAQGPIPVDDDFSSGDAAPPAHPDCRCHLAGAP